MDKTLGYYFERFIGICLGITASSLIYKNWIDGGALIFDKYYDIIIKVSSSIFGFLLTILALIVNGKSDTVDQMKKHNSYPLLIHYNKVAVFLAFTIIILSVFIYLIVAPKDGSTHFIIDYGEMPFKLLLVLHAGISVWSAIDTVIFVRIFYKIILAKKK